MRVLIDSQIHVPESEIPADLRRQVTAELTVVNGEKVTAVDQQVQTAYLMPDSIELWRADDELLTLPRGYAHRLEEAARAHGISIEWESDMTLLPPSERLHRDWRPASLRGYQEQMRDAMLDWAQTIIQAPTGSGKSRATAEFIRWSGQRALIVVGTTSLARQWEAVFRELYDYQVGFVGEGQEDHRGVTVGLWQSLKNVSNETFDSYGTIVLDEVHRASSDSLATLAQRSRAFYRIGLSATPRWDPYLWPIVQAVVGPIGYRVDEADLEEHLVQPRVRIVESSFSAEYVPARREGRRRLPNNYGEIISELVTDEARNEQIAAIVAAEVTTGHHVLVQTSRLEHVRILKERLERLLDDECIFVLTGKETGKESERIRADVSDADHGTAILTTIAKEGFDLPRIDRIVLAYPIKNVQLAVQVIGRGRRRTAGKDDLIVYDVVDPGCGPLKNQARERQKLYIQQRWAIEKEEEQPLEGRSVWTTR